MIEHDDSWQQDMAIGEACFWPAERPVRPEVHAPVGESRRRRTGERPRKLRPGDVRGDHQEEDQGAGALSAHGTHDVASQASATASNGVVHFKTYAHLVSVDPERNRRRFYTLSWQPTLFGGLTLFRSWGRIGTSGRSRAIFFADQEGAQKTVEGILKRRVGHGYAVVRWE